MRALLCSRRRVADPDTAFEETVHDGPCLQQIGEGTQMIRPETCGSGQTIVEVRPLSGKQRAASVGENHDEAQPIALHWTDDIQRHAFESMTLANDRHLARKVAVMGSVS